MNLIKICAKHGSLSQENILFEKNKYLKKGYQLRCLFCKKEKQAKYYKKNTELLIRKVASWKKENRNHVTNQAKLKRHKNPEQHKQWRKNYKEKYGQLVNLKEVTRRRGITPQDYLKMLENQNNACDICKQMETRMSKKPGKTSALSIDHDHKTNKIRALLCHSCNTGIGKFKDSVELLESAIAYLKRHSKA